MNTNLKKLSKKRGVVLSVLLCAAIIVCALLLIASLMKKGGAARPYTIDLEEGDRAYVDAYYMSDWFASFEANEDHKLYFVLDEDMYTYIVCISDKDMKAYEALQAWTFGETNVAPDSIRTEGVLVPIDREIKQMAIEEFNWFMGGDYVDSSNFNDYFGDYYIDAAVANVSGAPYVLVFVLLAAIVCLIINQKRNSKVNAASKAEMNRLLSTGESDSIDRELQDIRTKRFNNIGVYLTENYLVSYKSGLEVIPLHTISWIYGVSNEKRYGVVFRDNYGGEREAIKTSGRDSKFIVDIHSLIQAISEQTPDLEYGVNRERVEGTADIRRIRGFFGAKSVGDVNAASYSGTSSYTDSASADGTDAARYSDSTGSTSYTSYTDTSSNTELEPQKTNYLLGTIGAFIGALLGGVLWFAIGNFGYIVGIVGFAIIYLAALGFEKGAKRMTKGGAVIVVLISLFMIFAANYALYTWIVVRELGGRLPLSDALVRLPAIMKQYDITGDFIKDIAIGYVLSLIAGFSTISKMFRKK